MKSRSLKISTLVGASALMLGYAQAQTQFAFSFTSVATPYYIAGSVNGIITLNANQNEATSILLTSVPAVANSALGRDWVSDPAVTVFVNSFAVTGGNISAVNFDSDFFSAPGGELSLGFEDLLATAGGELYNAGNFSGITFTPEATPEPSLLALAALGSGVLLKFRRRK